MSRRALRRDSNSPVCGLKLEDNLPGSTHTPRLRFTFIFEMLFCPHAVLNEIAVFEKFNESDLHLYHSFVRQIACARDITRLLAVRERARKVFISIAVDW